MPFAAGANQKNCAENQGDDPPELEPGGFQPAQRTYREMYGEAAREQANRNKEGKFKNVLRLRTRHAFANIENVGDHKYGEDRGFSGDQTKHPHAAAGRWWTTPGSTHPTDHFPQPGP